VQGDRDGGDTDRGGTEGYGSDETTVFQVVAPHETETSVFRTAPAEDETEAFHAVVPGVPHVPGASGAPGGGDRPYAPTSYRPRRRRRFGLVVAFATVIAVAIGAAVVVGLRSERHDPDPLAGIAIDTPDLKRPPQRDFTIDTCTITRDGALVGGEVTNRTPDRADYALDAVLVDQDGNVITHGIATVAGVDTGTKARWQATLPPQASTATQTECKVVKIDRYESKG
jgi:hypothetical protein